MEQGATFLPFWSPMTLKINCWVVRGPVTVAKMISVVLLMSASANTLWAPPVSLSSFLLAFKNKHVRDWHMKANPPPTLFNQTWRIWDGVGRPVHKSQLLFYLLHVCFFRERCSFSRAWDHPGQWSSLETDGLLRWASLGTSRLTSQEIGWEIQSYCTTDPGASKFHTHTFQEGGKMDSQQSLAQLPFQAPCCAAWIPSS